MQYTFDPKTPKDFMKSQLRKSEAKFDMHGGENETSSLLYLRPDLVNWTRVLQNLVKIKSLTTF